jgi:hypothetical protein
MQLRLHCVREFPCWPKFLLGLLGSSSERRHDVTHKTVCLFACLNCLNFTFVAFRREISQDLRQTQAPCSKLSELGNPFGIVQGHSVWD